MVGLMNVLTTTKRTGSSNMEDKKFIKVVREYLEDVYHKDELLPGEDLRFRYQVALIAAIECTVAAARGYESIEDMPSEEYDLMHDPLVDFVNKEL